MKGRIGMNKTFYFNSRIIQCAGDQKTIFNSVNKSYIQGMIGFVPSYSSATGLAERFNHSFLTQIERIRHELAH